MVQEFARLLPAQTALLNLVGKGEKNRKQKCRDSEIKNTQYHNIIFTCIFPHLNRYWLLKYGKIDTNIPTDNFNTQKPDNF